MTELKEIQVPTELWEAARLAAQVLNISRREWIRQAMKEKLEDRCCDGSTIEDAIEAPVTT